MRPLLTRSIAVILMTIVYQAASAQTTYDITTNTNSSSFGGGVICTDCDIVISPGVTLTINSTCTCTTCTFSGGTVSVISGSNLTLNGLDSFKNETVLVGAAITSSTLTFYNDSIAFNASINLSSGGTTIDSSRVSVNQAMTFNTLALGKDSITQAANITGSNNLSVTGSYINMSGTSTITSNSTTSISSSTILMNGTNTFSASNALPITSSDITIGSGSTLTASFITITGGSITDNGGSIKSSNNYFTYGDTLTMSGASTLTAAYYSSHNNGATDGVINLSGSATVKSSNADTLSYTTTTMSGTSVMTGASGDVNHGSLNQTGNSNIIVTNTLLYNATSVDLGGNAIDSANILELDSSTFVQVGDGTTGTAHVWSNNEAEALVGSTLALDAHTNYFHTGVGQFEGGTTNYTLTATEGSCGSSGEHACVLDYIYGCATMNSSGVVACVTLAVSSIDLSAAITGSDAVALSWSDPQSATAERYLIQRSTGNSIWTTLATVDAGAYPSGDHRFEDQAPPAGTDDYRILRVDQDGNTSYSIVSSVTIAKSAGNAMAIYPNPVSGHTFYVSAPGTGQLVLSIFTLTGQLVKRATLQGQMQYPVQLPAMLLPGTTVVVQTSSPESTTACLLLLR